MPNGDVDAGISRDCRCPHCCFQSVYALICMSRATCCGGSYRQGSGSGIGCHTMWLLQSGCSRGDTLLHTHTGCSSHYFLLQGIAADNLWLSWHVQHVTNSTYALHATNGSNRSRSCLRCPSNAAEKLFTLAESAHCISMPYEPGLARALGAHERAVRRGPDP
jgi:hypothetical protein